jgi:hypothetical protein
MKQMQQIQIHQQEVQVHQQEVHQEVRICMHGTCAKEHSIRD